MRRLYTLVVGTDPRQLQFDFALWTRDLVRELIRREFEDQLSAVSGRAAAAPRWGSRRSGRCGGPGRPTRTRWRRGRTREFPAIRRPAKADGRDGLLRRRGRDPLGLPRRHHLGPGRQTPMVKATGARHSLNMISAVTAQGLLRFSTFTGSDDRRRSSSSSARKLLADTDGPGRSLPDRRRPPGPPAKLVKPWSPPPTASSSCSCCPPTPRSSTPTSGSGRTSSTTASAAPASRPRRVHALARRRAAPTAEPPAHRPGILRRPRPRLHHRMIESTNQRTP